MSTNDEREDRSSLRVRLEAGLDAFRDRNRRVDRIVGRAFDTSRVIEAVESLEPALHHSRVVRWLTGAPATGVVVVDLERTRSIGPVIRLVDLAIQPLDAVFHNSLPHRFVERIGASITHNPLRSVSVVALASVAAVLAMVGTPSLSLFTVSALLVGIAGLVGLAVDEPDTALAESQTVRAIVKALGRPENGDAASR